MSKNLPLVSIGIPVYNGENYLEEAINSVLKQTYNNFEVIISDNGSDDNTQAICEHYAAIDNRIKYYRLDKNYGAALNYNRTFQLSKGKYFKWLAHDDVLTKSNLSKSVKVLENNPDIVLCGSQKINIDADGRIGDQHNYQGLALNEKNPVNRFELLLKFFGNSFAHADFVFGLIRSDQLKNTHLIGNYTSADFTLLADLALKGSFHVIKEPLFLRRIHQGMSMSVNNNRQSHPIEEKRSKNKIVYKSHAQVAKWYDPNGKVRYIPHFKWLSELLNSISKSGVKQSAKLRLMVSTYKWFLLRFSKSIKENIQKRIINNLINKYHESRNFSRRSWHKAG